MPDLTEMTVESAKKTVWKFLWDFENDGFPLVFVDPDKGKGKTRAPDFSSRH